jgi:hypothetical protein
MLRDVRSMGTTGDGTRQLVSPPVPELLTHAVARDRVPARRFTPHILGSGARFGNG